LFLNAPRTCHATITAATPTPLQQLLPQQQQPPIALDIAAAANEPTLF
jgi:hypothetical protein